MNNLKNVTAKAIDNSVLSFGFSSLHAWILFFEATLHIAYNIEFKKWSAKSKKEKESKENRKNQIQKEFKDELGLIVDQMKQGVGTTNDGNTTRAFFRNPDFSSKITGVNYRLIYNFAVISCSEEINEEKIGNFTYETAKLYVSLYPRYYMPVSLHKILIHGKDIIKTAIVPIGQMSEKAQESRKTKTLNGFGKITPENVQELPLTKIYFIIY